MVDLDTSTPQLRLIKRLIDGYCSLDMNNVEPLLSKDYQCEILPAWIDLPKQTKESHLQMWGELFSPGRKAEMTFHEVIEAPGKVVLHATGIVSNTSGATFNHDTVIIYTLVEEDEELKIRYCKDFGNPEQRSALIAGTVGAAFERAA